jgi:hypothetical protein
MTKKPIASFTILLSIFTASNGLAAVNPLNNQVTVKKQMICTSVEVPDIKTEKVAFVDITPNRMFNMDKDMLIAEKVAKSDQHDFTIKKNYYRLVNFNDLKRIENNKSAVTSTAASTARLYFVKTNAHGVPLKVESAHQFKFNNLDMAKDKMTTDDGKSFSVNETHCQVPQGAM